LNKQHILDEIKRTAKAGGGAPLGKRQFLTETGIKESDWLGRYWARWSDAVREAGLVPNTRRAKTDEDVLLAQLGTLIRGSADTRQLARCGYGSGKTTPS